MTITQIIGGINWEHIIIKFLHYIWSSVILKVDCDRWNVYILDFRATTMILKRHK